ncbi:unnamed protein product [Meganyctiphanes norvegica]|uniref:Uncharacterized protein n=1 Tax=Meganyctiphanes norvegica TaxID=48144 RepID=A0AAV2R0L1_MEGNR
MGMVVHLVAVSMALMVVNAVHPWLQPICPVCPSTRETRSSYCGTWCEHPKGSGHVKCCDEVPDENELMECPVDHRKAVDCNKPKALADLILKPTRCFRNGDCPSGLWCCYDACLRQICKHPIIDK